MRAAEVLAELPEDMADYKGVIKYKDRAARWLLAHGPAVPTEAAS